MAPRAFTPAPAVRPRAASTTLVVRDGDAGLQVLMVKRSLQATFMPGAYVFPGGAVDAEDGADGAALACDETLADLTGRIGVVADVGDHALAYAVAALRECFEECGLWLGAGRGATLDWPTLRRRVHAGESMSALASASRAPLATSALHPWSHWVTPVGMHKRFDTLFFVARAPEGQEPEVDAGETTTLAWVRPSTALQEHASGEFPMEFATVRTVESLQPFADTAALFAQAASLRHLPALHPRLLLDREGRVTGVVLPGQPGYDTGFNG